MSTRTHRAKLFATTSLLMLTPSPAFSSSAERITMEALYLGKETNGHALITPEDLPADPAQTFETHIDDLDASARFAGRLSWYHRIAGRTVGFSAFVTRMTTADGIFIDNTPGESTNLSYAQAAGRDVDTERSEQAHRYVLGAKHTLGGAEVNLPLGTLSRHRHRLTLSAGARTLFTRDAITATAFDVPLTFPAAFLIADDARLEATSVLIGPQLSADVEADLTPRLSIGANIKAGLFASANHVTAEYATRDNPTNALTKKTRSLTLARALEINPRVTWKLSPHTTLRAGAMLLWINGHSEGSREFRVLTDADRGVLGEGNTFYYGASVGLTYRFDAPNEAPQEARYTHLQESDPTFKPRLKVDVGYSALHTDKTPLTYADEDPGTHIGREVTADSVSGEGGLYIAASAEVPMFGHQVSISGFHHFETTASNRSIVDLAERTNAAYTYGNLNAFVPASSVNFARLDLDHSHHFSGGALTIKSAARAVRWGDWSISLGAALRHYGASLSSTAYADASDSVGTTNNIDRVSVEANNLMLGPLLGIETTIPLPNAGHWTIAGTVGLYANMASAERHAARDAAPADRVSSDANDVRLAHELSLSSALTLPIGPRISFTANGQARWISGITDAAEQYALAVTKRADIEADASLLALQASLGVTISLN